MQTDDQDQTTGSDSLDETTSEAATRHKKEKLRSSVLDVIEDFNPRGIEADDIPAPRHPTPPPVEKTPPPPEASPPTSSFVIWIVALVVLVAIAIAVFLAVR